MRKKLIAWTVFVLYPHLSASLSRNGNIFKKPSKDYDELRVGGGDDSKKEIKRL